MDATDQPSPPGGPLREDQADTTKIPQPETQDVRPAEHDGRDPAGIDEPAGTRHGTRDDTDPAPRDIVEENAETSLDQPSDSSGGE
jgi:hypothetical protein